MCTDGDQGSQQSYRQSSIIGEHANNCKLSLPSIILYQAEWMQKQIELVMPSQRRLDDRLILRYLRFCLPQFLADLS